MKIVAIDPGKKILGVAVFVHGELVECSLLVVANALSLLTAIKIRQADIYVIENQQIYGRLQQKGDPNDLLELAHISGMLRGFIVSVSRAEQRDVQILRPKPREWKGTITKQVHHNRLEQQYPQAVAMMVEQKIPVSYRHNVWDAIGLGDWALKKIGVENEIKKI